MPGCREVYFAFVSGVMPRDLKRGGCCLPAPTARGRDACVRPRHLALCALSAPCPLLPPGWGLFTAGEQREGPKLPGAAMKRFRRCLLNRLRCCIIGANRALWLRWQLLIQREIASKHPVRLGEFTPRSYSSAGSESRGCVPRDRPAVAACPQASGLLWPLPPFVEPPWLGRQQRWESHRKGFIAALWRSSNRWLIFFFSLPKPVLFIPGKQLMLTHFGAEIKAKLLS